MKPSFLFFAFTVLFSISVISLHAGGKEDKAPLLVLNETSGKYEYDHVYKYDSTKYTQEQVYKNVKNYILSTLKTNDNNVTSDDKTFTELLNHGFLILKPINGFNWTIDKAVIDFKIHIYFKNGRLKLLINNISYQAENMAPDPNIGVYEKVRNKKFKKAVNDALSDLVAGVEKAMQDQSAMNDNW